MDSTGVGGRRHRTATLVLAVIALVAVVRLPSFVRELFDPDEAAIAAQAIAVRDGGTLYVDAVDRKPPLPSLIYAASFEVTDSTDLRPLHGLVAAGLVGAALVLAFDARRRWGEAAAWWAAGLTVLGAVAFFPVDAQAANFAHFALFPGAAAIVWSRRGRPGWALAGGIALGVAVLCRQSWFVGIVPGVVGALFAPRRGRRETIDAARAVARPDPGRRAVRPRRGRRRGRDRARRPVQRLLAMDVHQQRRLRDRRRRARGHPRPVRRHGGHVRRLPPPARRDGLRGRLGPTPGVAGVARWTSTSGSGWPPGSCRSSPGSGSSATTGCRRCRRPCCWPRRWPSA